MVAQVDREYASVAGWRTIRRFASYLFFEGRPATTKGQFFNPVVFFNIRLGARLTRDKAPDRPIFIVGVGRSGTTHLGRLMSVHPEVGFLNEPKAMWHVIDPTEDVSGFYNRGTGRFTYTAADADSDVRARAWRTYSYYSRVTGAKRVVDKYPELTYRSGYLRALFPGAVIIAIVREPSSVIRSIDNWSATHRTGDEDWWGVADSKWEQLVDQLVADDPVLSDELHQGSGRQTPPRALVEWIVGMRAVVTGKKNGTIDLVVRYEDLVARPRETLASVFTVCELPEDEVAFSFAESETEKGAQPVVADDYGRLQPEVDALRRELGYK